MSNPTNDRIKDAAAIAVIMGAALLAVAFSVAMAALDMLLTYAIGRWLWSRLFGGG